MSTTSRPTPCSTSRSPGRTDWVAQCAASPLVGGARTRADARLAALARSRTGTRSSGSRASCSNGQVPPLRLDRPLPRAGPAVQGRRGDDQRRPPRCARCRGSLCWRWPRDRQDHTVARLLALLREQQPEWRIALAAPTGKAAARLDEAVASSRRSCAADRARLGELQATTLHRLLGWRPGSRSRFRHDPPNRLPYEVVVVDESSMVSLTMMARLLEALRPTTRLVLVGDPDQLASSRPGRCSVTSSTGRC